MLNSRQPIWDKAYEKLISTGNAVKIPLDFGKAEIIVNSTTKSIVPFSSLNYLLMYKDSLEQIHAEWVSLVPQASWLEKQSSAYRGQVFVKDWAGKLIKSYSYNMVQPQPKAALGAKGKIMSATETPLTLPVYAESYCIRLPTGVCTCTAPPCDWRSCNVCGKTICGLVWSGGGGDEPDQEPENNNGQNYDGWTPTSHSGGGGVTNWTDYLPSCNPDPNYTVPNYPVPNGQDWVMSCYGLPLPESPIFEAREYMTNYMGITDLNKQNFLLSNSDVYGSFVDYLLANGDTPENKNFIGWAAGFLIQNPNLNPNISRLESIYQLIQLQNYIPKDREPATYYWRPILANSDFSSHLTETTPKYIVVNGELIKNVEAYNCHYYAFGLQYATLLDEGFPKWVLNIQLKGWQEVAGNIKVGDRVVYYQDYNGQKDWTHSGIVVEVDAEGYATRISSKMGQYQIIEHHPRDIPEIYGNTAPTFLFNGSTILPSRVYFRKK